MRLTDAVNAITYKIRGVTGASEVARRLAELGVVRGAEIRVLGRSLLGDPLRVRLGDSHLALRAAEAGLVELES